MILTYKWKVDVMLNLYVPSSVISSDTLAPSSNSVDEIANSTTLNTSQKIRKLNELGMSKYAIAKKLGKRYQHVYNVLATPLKKG